LIEEYFEAVLEPADDELPAERITIPLNLEELPGPLYLQLMVAPQEKPSEMEGVEMLQFFVPFPITEPFSAEAQPTETEKAAADIIAYLPHLNLEAPLMGFNYDPYERLIYFRHLALLPGDADVGRAVVETVWLIYFLMDNMAAEVIALALGQVSLSELIDDNN
jgi:hypothetical protein